MSPRTSDFDYSLPPDRIATHPLACRDASRMMVLNRSSRGIEHRQFRDLPTFLRAGDLAVLNDSKVIRARLPCLNGRGELLLVEQTGPNRWVCLVRPGRAWKAGMRQAVAEVMAEVLEVLPGGERLVQFDTAPDLERHGTVPLPPYLGRNPEPDDEHRYQNVYAGPVGSVAAPTAGLHFTREMLERIPHTFLTLHVGPGTFLPVKTENIREHRMHEERYVVSPAAAASINAAGRILAVGTTVTRVLESQPAGPLRALCGRTAIFIHPPYSFRRVDMLLTNFHLPQSTLLMLVGAFAGREFVLEAYATAVREKYRFFSYGDCMLIV